MTKIVSLFGSSGEPALVLQDEPAMEDLDDYQQAEFECQIFEPNTPKRSMERWGVPRNQLGREAAIQEYRENRALQLAEREEFYQMAKSSLWGSEDRFEYGELLRGLVQNFLPENRYHLELLSGIADATWKLHRMRRLQQSIFQSNPSSPGADGVNRRTSLAMAYDKSVDAYQKTLEQAMRLYERAKKNS